MKKLLTIAVAALLSVTAFSQTRLGVEGGLNIAYMTGVSENSGAATAPFAGGNLGFVAEFKFGDLVGIRTGAEYSMHGVAAYKDWKYSAIYGHYFIFPALLTFSFSDDRLMLGVGPQLGVCAGMQYRFYNDWIGGVPLRGTIPSDMGIYNICDCSIDVLLKFMFTENLGLKLQYNFGVTDVFNKALDWPTGGVPTFVNAGYNANFVGQISLVYMFDEL